LMPTLEISNFAQIDSARIEFGDLTVLVGPQATGKSLLLQWFKMALDAGEVVSALREAGHDVSEPSGLIDLVFGEGMSSAWHPDTTRVEFDSRELRPSAWSRGRKKGDPRVLYIPAHRALLLAEGWPSPFIRLNADTPVVARLFSQSLYQRFSGPKASTLFPAEGFLRTEYRDLIDQAVFNGGRVKLIQQGLRYRLGLSYGSDYALPFMTWTAGQRAFTPLLLGLYDVLPLRRQKKIASLDFVVIEEPEMGLHPEAVVAFMILVFDLMARGYKVVLSTHSPLILDAVWALQTRAANGARAPLVCQAFGLKDSRPVRDVMQNALESEYRVHHLGPDPATGRVRSKDISELDPLSEDPSEAEWGGLAGFSSRLGEAVRTAVNTAEGVTVGPRR